MPAHDTVLPKTNTQPAISQLSHYSLRLLPGNQTTPRCSFVALPTAMHHPLLEPTSKALCSFSTRNTTLWSNSGVALVAYLTSSAFKGGGDLNSVSLSCTKRITTSLERVTGLQPSACLLWARPDSAFSFTGRQRKPWRTQADPLPLTRPGRVNFIPSRAKQKSEAKRKSLDLSRSQVIPGSWKAQRGSWRDGSVIIKTWTCCS